MPETTDPDPDPLPASPGDPAVVVREIRVHGVNNSPPAEMLETTPDAVEVSVGAGTGIFWKRRAPWRDDGVDSVEAYSWGAQTRTSGTALALIGTAFVRVGWFLLLPYALVNLAYWTRELPEQPDGAREWRGGVGAGVIRLFGLVLTLLAVTAFTTVAVDLVSRQCFHQGAAGVEVCGVLPPGFDLLRGWKPDVRAAVLALAPIAVMIVLYLIVRRGRVKFEPSVEDFGEAMDAAQSRLASAGRPLLSTPGFWAAARIRDTSEALHLAASVFAVVSLLTLPGAFTPLEPVRLSFGIAGVVGIVVAATLVVRASSTTERGARSAREVSERRRGQAFGCLGVAVAVFAAWLVVVLVAPAGGPATLLDVDQLSAPTILTSVALFLALWALSWSRRSTARRWGGFALLAGAGACFVTTRWLPADAATATTALTLAGLALIGVHVVLCLRPARPASGPSTAPEDLAVQAWQGRGAAVAMMLALLLSLSLNSLLVLGVSSWLTTLAPVGTDKIWRIPPDALTPAEWRLPDAYEKAAIVLLLVVTVTLVVLAVTGVRLLRRRALVGLTLPGLYWSDDQRSAASAAELREDAASGVLPRDAAGGPAPLPAAYPETVAADAGARAVIRAQRRRVSQLLHRGEALGTWVAGASAVGLILLASPGSVAFLTWAMEHLVPGSPTIVRLVAVSALAVIALGAVAGVVANAVTRKDRPLGIFWDVVGFFPRAAHPFAPPCFSERSVPELVSHVRMLTAPPTARVLLTAHSMGTTICTAVILALRGEGAADGGAPLTDRLAFLSFGSQLRGYFSRFFPSVLGCEVLGVPGLSGPSLWRLDPWETQVRHEFGPLAEPLDQARDDTTLRGMLTPAGATAPRWLNLWRRTDFLGFPVAGYRENAIDRGASEDVPGYLWVLATHSPYLGIAQFRTARLDLATALRTGSAPARRRPEAAPPPGTA